MQGEKFEVLVATMQGAFRRRSFDCQEPMLVIDQTDTETPLVACQAAGMRVVETQQRGLSKSRNHALSLAEGDICLIADDDISLLPGFKERILAEFRAAPDADIITFQVRTPDGGFFKANYGTDPAWHTLRSIMRVCSVEIAFRRERVLKAGIRFDEQFGLGANFPTGEEAIFLADAIRSGLKVKYAPMPIVVHERESSGAAFVGNPRLIKAKGAMFWRIFGVRSLPISLLFAFLKYRQSKMAFWRFAAYMFAGKQEYKRVACK